MIDDKGFEIEDGVLIKYTCKDKVSSFQTDWNSR